jgi:hypothetical protein
MIPQNARYICSLDTLSAPCKSQFLHIVRYPTAPIHQSAMTQILARVDSSQRPQYRPLVRPSDQTRVLRLLPGLPGSTIRAQLLTVEFEATRRSRYEAVSYVWVRFVGTSDIEIRDVIYTVPTSAEDVLQAVRYKDSERLIWIDAICINQIDQTEKQHQVAIIGRIYQEADRTVFWLGEADEHTELASGH